MIKIAGIWDLSWSTPIQEIDMWEMVLLEFKVDQFWVTPVSGMRSGLVTQERNSMQEILSDNEDLISVFCSEKAETELQNFNHPENCIYVFGRSNYSPFNNLKKRSNDLAVRIETPSNKGLLYSHQAASIILYDRMIKYGSNNN